MHFCGLANDDNCLVVENKQSDARGDLEKAISPKAHGAAVGFTAG